MLVRSLGIPEVKLVTPKRFFDERGFFCETYTKRNLTEAGIDAEFVQDNHSLSVVRGTVRGLHFQIPPHAQGKLLRVVHGAIFDVVVDIRRGSPSFGQHVSTVLSAENWDQLWVPVGFAHGFCTLEPNTEVLYKTTDYYSPDSSFGIRWDDPALQIAWPVRTDEVILSTMDRTLPLLSELPLSFQFGM
jgi:dTDP-4-dehydrorhamnose 3,5-epimerase